jgi:phage protein D
MPADYFTQCIIKIGGSVVPEDFMDALDEVVVDSSLYLPDMFTIRLHDYDLKWTNDALLDIGKEVEISVETGSELGSHKDLLIKGEITALEPHFDVRGDTSLTVRGYDKSHRLHRGRKTRTFLKQKDDSLVRTIAGEVGLSPQVDATTVTYDYVLQNNQTNMGFLLARAERIGYQVYAAEGKLYFKKGDATLGDGPTLTFMEDLDSFQPCLTASGQVDKMSVKSWDPKGKVLISANATPNGSLNQGGMQKTGGDIAKVFGAAELVVTDQPVFSSTEATALATGLSNDINRESMQAEGECLGNPQVKAGWTITIKGVGDRFNGKYFVTSATHIYNAGAYITRFSITGSQPNTLSRLLESGNGHKQSIGMVQGVVPALVTNVQDPDNLGRVKVKYAWLGDIESDWIRISSPMAGPERGFFYLPEVDDEVLIAFEHSDVHRPYIIGALWNSKDKPPKPTSQVIGGGKVNERIIKSRSGHTVVLDDTDGAEKIIIRDKTEKNEMVIDTSTNSMTIKVDGDFVVDAKGKITLKSTQDMSLESQASGKIKANTSLNVEANTSLNVEAKGNSTIKGVQLTLEGTAMSALKAPTVSVQGSALAEVKAALVKIN